MRYTLLVLIILFACYLLSAQEIIEIESADSVRIETADSLTIIFEQDSLEFSYPDSLQIFSDTMIDSLNFSEMTEEDSLDVVELYNNLQKFLAAQKKMREDFQLPFIVEKENFHWKTPFNPNLHFSKNGFTDLPLQVSNIHTIQNFKHSFNTVYNQGFVDFSLDDYSLPVAATDAYLGLGDINMNHAAFNYNKGNIFGIPDLNIAVSYLGMDGYWLGKREKTRNFNGHLFYDHDFGKFHFYYTNLNQEISSNKLAAPPQQLKLIKNISAEIAFKWENPYLDMGYRSEESKVDTLKRKLSEILVTKTLIYKTHQLKLSYEYFMNSTDDENFSIFNLAHHSDFSFLDFSNRIFYEKKENYFASSLLKLELLSFLQPQIYIEKQAQESSLDLWQNERIGAGLIIDFQKFSLNLLSGTENISDEDITFIESNLQTNCEIGILNMILRNWTLARKTDNLFLPELQTQTSLEFQLNVQHGNFIKLGFSNIYLSEYGYFQNDQETMTLESFANFNAWLAFQITKQFQIKLDAVNLTNAESFFGLPASENLAGRHFNFNVQWIFIN